MKLNGSFDSLRNGSVPGKQGVSVLFAVVALLTALAPRPAYAARIYPSAGTTSASFLKIGVGARAVSMAGAYTALSDDAYAVYWNPAGLAQPVGKSLAFTHNEYFQGLSQEYFGFTLPGENIKLLRGSVLRNGHLGLGLNYFYTPKDMERRSGLNETFVAVSPVEGKFGAYDLAFSAAYGFSYSRDLRLGAAVKVIRQSIDTESGNTAALDLGALYDFPWLDRQFTAGFSVQNLGPGVKFNSKSFALPLTFKAGLSHRIYEKGLLVSLDLSKPVDNYPSIAVGLEHPLSSRLYLRSGYRYRQHGNELGAFSGLAAGLGFIYDNLSFDYAFSPFGDLGAAHRISLAFRFQPPFIPAPKRPTGGEPAVERLEGAAATPYTVSKRPLKISPRGVDYAVEAVSGQAALNRIEFKARQRGAGEIVLEVLEGNLPQTLTSRLPKGYRPLLAWQFGSGFTGTNGDISLTFSFLEVVVKSGETGLFYLTSSGWRKAYLDPAVCVEGACSLVSGVPLSSHYVLAVKN